VRFNALVLTAVVCWSIGVVRAAGPVQAVADPSTLPDAAGRVLLFRDCAECHGPETVTAQRRSRAEWQGVVDDMAGRGAATSEDERKTLVSYLSVNVGRVNVNKASEDELKTIVGLKADEAAAIVAYRVTAGAFKTLDDLKRVPGIDARALDERKDRIVFAGQ
jgi:competence protein ComEA